MTMTIHHHPTTATGRDWRRAKRPYKMTVHTLQDTSTSWDKYFIRHSPRQRDPDGPPAKIERAHWIMSALFGCDAVVVEERFLHPALAFFCLASSNERHCSMTISIQRRCSMTISIQRFLLQYSSVFLPLVLYVPAVAHWCLLPCTCEG